MSAYLLNHLSTELFVLVSVGVPTLIAVIAVYCVDLTIPGLHGVEMDDTVRDVVGLVFGLLLALVIASIVAKHDQADSATAAESTATAQLARATRTFPIGVQIEFEQAIGQYIHAVVDDEWPAMTTGHTSVKATAALETIYGTLQSFHPVGEPDISVYRQALVQLDQISSSRRERLDLSSQTLPGLLRLLLIFGAVSFIVLSYPTAINGRLKKMAITGAITAFVSFAYLLTIVFDYPFAGPLAVSNSSFMAGDLAIYGASPTARVVPPADLATISPADVVGVWTSAAFGPTVFRDVHGEVLGALRLARGTVVAHISRNVLRGTWCEDPTRKLPNKIGQVQWRMTKSGGRDHLVGAWRYGTTGPMRGGWDLTRIGGSDFEPPDVTPLFNQPSAFCRHVRAPRAGPARAGHPGPSR
ncbi:MAG: hypothetical protein QOE27_2447 [Solirubrobacteraceae bacterium]|jgi:hypothetical protein|nr:hypothetical protein [Solirubrobacteraceae bacterium]